jgi:hypothetical protein
MGASQRSGIRRVVVDLPPCVAQSITDDASKLLWDVSPSGRVPGRLT